MSLLAACVQPNQNSYYFDTSGGGGSSVQSVANGGNLTVTTASGVCTITNPGLLSIRTAQDGNGLVVTPSAGNVVITYNAPPVAQSPYYSVDNNVLSLVNVTLDPGNTALLRSYVAADPSNNLVQIVMGIKGPPGLINVPWTTPGGGSAALTGIPAVQFWWSSSSVETAPPATFDAGQQHQYWATNLSSGSIPIGSNMYFVVTPPNPATGTVTDGWHLYATNKSTGNAILGLNFGGGAKPGVLCTASFLNNLGLAN